MNDLAAAVQNPALRFWSIEHAGGMLAVVVLVRMGRVLAMNARSPTAARNRRFACFAFATAVMVVTIPWPGLSQGRPLFRAVERELGTLGGGPTAREATATGDVEASATSRRRFPTW
jgi:hypothetical protein